MLVGVKVELKKPDDFLLVKESLTRIGIANNAAMTLTQTAHILHKRGEYFICHFKEMFYLDGKPSTLSPEDLTRRNLIVKLLCDWNLIVADTKSLEFASMSSIKIVPYKEKSLWKLIPKYSIGVKNFNFQKGKSE